MLIVLIHERKKDFLDLLLLADEQENMIDEYLERGDMFALYDHGLKCVSVVTKEEENLYELKNIAVYPEFQRIGYGSVMLGYLFEYYGKKAEYIQVGTGDVPKAISFYEKAGFRRSHTIQGFFTDNYDHPIYEDGVLLTDMIYLKREL